MSEVLTQEEIDQLKREHGVTDQEIQDMVNQYNALTPSSFDSPDPPRKDDLLRFIRDVLALENKEYQKISRVGNLQKEEMGRLTLTVRTYQDIGLFCDSEGLDDVAKYLRNKSIVTLDTSLSRSGMFIRLPFSNTRIHQQLSSPKKTVSKSLFGGTKEVYEGVPNEP